MIVTDDIARWEWCKWLPHCAHPTQRDRGGPARMVWSTGEQMDAAVGTELHSRDAFRAGTTKTPHWLVIDDRRRRGDDRHWETLTRAGGVAGVTFLGLADQPGRGLGFADDSSYVVSGARSPTVVSGSAGRTTWTKPAPGRWPARWPATGWRVNARAS